MEYDKDDPEFQEAFRDWCENEKPTGSVGFGGGGENPICRFGVNSYRDRVAFLDGRVRLFSDGWRLDESWDMVEFGDRAYKHDAEDFVTEVEFEEGGHNFKELHVETEDEEWDIYFAPSSQRRRKAAMEEAAEVMRDDRELEILQD
jgi:hypothetical protein